MLSNNRYIIFAVVQFVIFLQISYVSSYQVSKFNSILSRINSNFHPSKSWTINKSRPLSALYSVSSDKTRVRLLADVKGIGKKGEIVFVSPPMYTNVLQVKKTAVKISDDEMKAIESKEKETAKNDLLHAQEMSSAIQSLPSFQIRRKVGANKQLFGSVSTKVVLEELKKLLPVHSLDGKAVALVSIEEIEAANSDNNKEIARTGELRRAGGYVALLKLHAAVEPVSFRFEIVSEKP